MVFCQLFKYLHKIMVLYLFIFAADDGLGFDKHDSESIKLDSGGYTGVLCSICQVCFVTSI